MDKNKIGSDKPSNTVGRKINLRHLSVISIITVLCIWQATSIWLGASPTGFKLVPSIPEVMSAFIRFAGYWPGGLGAESTLTGAEPTYWGAFLGFVYNMAISMLRVFIGYFFGVTVGILLALAISYSSIIRGLFEFPAHFARMMPLLAMLPLFALWFGNSELGSVLFIAYAVGIVVFAIALNALGNVPEYYVMNARSLGANRLRAYLWVVFPAAIPQIRSGILLGVAFSWSAGLASEFLGKSSGLGHILNFALYYAATDMIALTGILVIVVSATTFVLVNRLLEHLTRWTD